MKHAIAVITTVLVALVAFSGCDKSDYEYCTEQCYFVFDNSEHLSSVLQGALNSTSPGTFCRITTRTSNGAKVFHFEDNYGNTDDKYANAKDQRRSCVLGIYNKTGIIVGYGNLGLPATLYAYDSQCPNCYYSTNTPSYCLSMTSAGHAVCSNCKREYDMNNGGIVAKGDAGKKLLRYRRVTCTGPQGILSVQNP
jgi:hypothetical protein